MDKNAIKTFSVWARRKLIADVKAKAGLLGITDKGIAAPLPQSTGNVQFFDIGTKNYAEIAGNEIYQRNMLADAIKTKAAETGYEKAFEYVVEAVAYTWFNRLIAIRFMEVNDYLPSHVRVLSSDTQGKTEPDIVTSPYDTDLEFTDKEKEQIMQMKNENHLDELFRMLFIKQCAKLGEVLPNLFSAMDDYIELLLTISFTDKEGIVYHLTHDIAEQNFDVSREGQVEIIGWMYQYYNSEPKDKVFADLKKNIKITKDTIPAATQLFTPDWIVRYMVENSLGRVWVEHLIAAGSSETEAEIAQRFGWKYYLPEAEQDPEVAAQLVEIRKERRSLSPEEITVIDPCMGSGHILVYMFEVLMQIYTDAGYIEKEALKCIMEKNLHGLDIDSRAAQLAYFAVMMKGRQYDRRLLSRGYKPMVYAFDESNIVDRTALNQRGVTMPKAEKTETIKQMNTLLDSFIDAKEYGSIITVPVLDWELLHKFVDDISYSDQMMISDVETYKDTELLHLLINLGCTLAKKYDACVTNPPYMGASNMSARLSSYVKKNYVDSKFDLYSVFIERCHALIKSNGYQSLITQQSWMFVTSFENLREKLQCSNYINMIHLGSRAFDEINGEVVQTTAFILGNRRISDYISTFCRLISGNSEAEKERLFFNQQSHYRAIQEKFIGIPGAPVAYWCSSAMYKIFDNSVRFGTLADGRRGTVTGDDNKFLRLWHEIGKEHFSIFNENANKWFPNNKGGEFRKWFGNNWFVLDWANDGHEIKNYKDEKGKLRSRPQNTSYFFKKGITWTYITSQQKCFRYYPEGFTFAGVGPGLFPHNNANLLYMLAYCNSKVYEAIMTMMGATTISLESGEVERSPIIINEELIPEVNHYTEQNISLSESDWDSYETSWDFQRLPILPVYADEPDYAYLVSAFYEGWKESCNDRFVKLKANEEELNRIFIDIYGLQDELTPDVADKDVTVHCVYDTWAEVPDNLKGSNYVRTKRDEIVSLISYAVGSMFGRYSLDSLGLAYAGGEWDSSKYYCYEPDEDNCIPITDTEYFSDDIVGRFVDFIRVTYGAPSLEENLKFIADALEGKGDTPREVIRNYFLNDFFKDHCQTYSVTGSGKRPIYWLFDSGKQNGFKALVYMHRWNADTIGNVRVEYLHKVQKKYESEMDRLQEIIETSDNSKEVGKAQKRREVLKKQAKECADYDAKIGHLANFHIDIDLDDGVKKNYRKVQTDPTDGKFYEILADSKNIMAKE